MAPKNNPNVLIMVADTALQHQLLSVLTGTETQICTAGTVTDAIHLMHSDGPDVVFCDLPTFGASQSLLMHAARRQSPVTDIILLCAPDQKAGVLPVIGRDISDFLTLPLNPDDVIAKTRQVLEHRRLRRELADLRTHVAMNFGYDNIIGISKPITQLRETAARIAPTDISVLLTGPSGSGKELLARTIHHHSERRRNRFVAIDCSAVAENAIETELFGQVAESAGSHSTTGRSMCEEADGGTLFLDEVAALPLSAQARLLHFMQDGLIAPTGGGQPRKVDVRVIATSNTTLSSLVANGKFREDLYYKLAVIPITVPALADRTEDIEMLTGYFLRRLSGELARPEIFITRAAIDKLLSHTWPGNVRELENTLRRAVALCTDNQLDAFNITFVASGSTTAPAEVPREGRRSLVLSGGLLVNHQREIIVQALDDNRWNFTRTAAALGIGRTTLWRKVKKYNLVPAGGLPEQD